jgi:hypothetical protein
MIKIMVSSFATAMAVVGIVMTAAAEDHPRVQAEEHGEYKVFRFASELSAGDCRLDNATVTIHRNGEAEFSGSVWTHTHGRDQWHSTVFLEGPDGLRKGLGHGDSPWMPHDADGPQHPRDFRYYFHFDAPEFDHIKVAWEHGDC